jgi:hypothetical protein
MSWKFVKSTSFYGRYLPVRILGCQLELQWTGEAEIELALIKLNVQMPDLPGVSWPEIILPQHGQLRPGDSTYPTITLPVERQLIQAIEDWRQGRSIFIRLKGYIGIHYRELLPMRSESIIDRSSTTKTIPVYQPPRPQMRQVELEVNVQRDQWLETLKSLGWNEFEVFEMAIRPMRTDGRFQKALQLLNAAQTALRQGQWSAVATDARRALEAAATVVSPDEKDRKAKFEALIKEILPGEHDGAKRDMLAGLMLSLRQLRDEAAHAHNLNSQIEREDAELAFSVAVQIFRYIGEALARRAN